jgi:hypothetical protein
VDQQSGPLDLNRDERLRSNLESSPRKKKMARNGGDGVQMSTVVATPAIFRGGEVVNGQQIVKVVTSVCLVTSFASQNNGYGRMETKTFDDTPARNYRRTGGL